MIKSVADKDEYNSFQQLVNRQKIVGSKNPPKQRSPMSHLTPKKKKR
jgi:hypothetical protein